MSGWFFIAIRPRRTQARFSPACKIAVGGGDADEVVEDLQPLGIVHIGGDLRAHGVDVYLLPVQTVQDAYGFIRRLVAEVLADECLYIVELGLECLPVRAHDGGGQDEEAVYVLLYVRAGPVPSWSDEIFPRTSSPDSVMDPKMNPMRAPIGPSVTQPRNPPIHFNAPIVN